MMTDSLVVADGDTSTCANSTLGDEELNHAAYDQLLQQITSNWMQREEQFKNCVDRLQNELELRGAALEERERVIMNLATTLDKMRAASTESAASINVTPLDGNAAPEACDTAGAVPPKLEIEDSDITTNGAGLAYLDCSFEDCHLALREFCQHLQKQHANLKQGHPSKYDSAVVDALCGYSQNEALELCRLQASRAAVDSVGCTISIQVWHDCVVRPLQEASQLITAEGVSFEHLLDRLEKLVESFHEGYRECADNRSGSSYQTPLFAMTMAALRQQRSVAEANNSLSGEQSGAYTAAGSFAGEEMDAKTPAAVASNDNNADEEDVLYCQKPDILIQEATNPQDMEEEVEKQTLLANQQSESTANKAGSTSRHNATTTSPPQTDSDIAISATLLKLPGGFQSSGSFDDASYSTREAHIEADRATAPVQSLDMFSPKGSGRRQVSTSTARLQSSEGNYGEFGASPATPTPVKPLRLSRYEGAAGSPNLADTLGSSTLLSLRSSAGLGNSYSTSAPPLSPRSREDIDKRREENFKVL